jgi:hypothetical protein
MFKWLVDRCFARGFNAVALVVAAWVPLAQADGVVVDKVYDPYVQPLETEIEWRAVGMRDDEKDDLDSLQIHRLGLGHSFAEHWFGEVYLIGERDEDESFRVEGVELEAKWQLTEQGEYAADWGLLFELERERSEDQWEAAATLISVREWGRWVGTANLAAIYEWGSELDNEFESQLRLQGRYRLSEAFEPALEFYAGQDTLGIGPVIRGLQRLRGARQLRWELGLIQGITDKSPDQTLRLLLEYEFY